ncbi:MAG: hypothetical protein KGS46_16490 [Chloroflexi bacterium]|nr:hypothetical protein [Chloroflexota bacterium]
MTDLTPLPVMTQPAKPPTPLKDISIFDLPEWTGEVIPLELKQDDAFAGVRFQPVSKIYHYRTDGFDGLKVNDWVIVDTARGKQMAQIATLKPPKDKGSMAFRRIERRATGRDMATRHYYENKELEAMIACRAEASALQLPIKIVKADYSFDGQTLTFNFSTIEDNVEVDVRQLHEAMSHLYQARVELRQIGPREVAKILGGMGACGVEERCCSKFLSEFSPISIKHAKEQNISLNPTDITGMCGRLRCCLIYEYEQYVEARRYLPKLKSMIGTPQGIGKVIELLSLRDSAKVQLTNGEIRREVVFHREQLVPLEEYQRLQEKAISGKCDKHEGGGCDCGRDKSAKDKTEIQIQQDSLSAIEPKSPKSPMPRPEHRPPPERRPMPERRPEPERQPPKNTIADGNEEIEVVSMAEELGLEPLPPRDTRARGEHEGNKRPQTNRDNDRGANDRNRSDRNREPRARNERGPDAGHRQRRDERGPDQPHASGPNTSNTSPEERQERRKPLRRRSE